MTSDPFHNQSESKTLKFLMLMATTMENTTPQVDRRQRQGKHGSSPAISVPDVKANIPNTSSTSLTIADSTILPHQARSDRTPKSHIGKVSSKPSKSNKSTGNSHIPTHPNGKSQPKKAGTPMKAAYAGPTFHSSPAPSTLPMPSFLSKSVPDAATTTTPIIGHREGEGQSESSSTSSASGLATDTEGRPHSIALGREPSPLDFLFDAARQARQTPHTKSPAAVSRVATPMDESPSHRAQSTKASADRSLFPIEVDGSRDQPTAFIGPAFATPYHQRMNAFKATRSEAMVNASTLDEHERKAKTEALKNLLMKSQSPRSASASPPAVGMSSENRNDHPLNSNASSTSQLRNSSGPATPSQPGPLGRGRTYIDAPQNGSFQPQHGAVKSTFQESHSLERVNGQGMEHPPSQTSFSPGRNRFPQYDQIDGAYSPSRNATHVSTSSLLADDLRRVLQLGEQSAK